MQQPTEFSVGDLVVCKDDHGSALCEGDVYEVCGVFSTNDGHKVLALRTDGKHTRGLDQDLWRAERFSKYDAGEPQRE